MKLLVATADYSLLTTFLKHVHSTVDNFTLKITHKKTFLRKCNYNHVNVANSAYFYILEENVKKYLLFTC